MAQKISNPWSEHLTGPRLFLWGLGGVAFVLLFALWRPHIPPGYLDGVIYSHTALVMAGGLYVFASICWIRRDVFHRRNVFRACVCIITFAGGIGILEAVVRTISPPPMFLSTLPSIPNIYERREDIQLRGVSPTSIHSTNKWGLRGDPVPADWNSTFTILAIGGSTTHCFYLDDKRTWPYLVQEKLKSPTQHIWVGNAGFDGHTTRGHLLVMEHVVEKTRPDALLFLVGVNDLALSLDEEARRDGRQYDKTQFSPPQWAHPLDHSRLFQIGRIWKRYLFDDVPINRKSLHTMPEYRQTSKDEFAPLPDDLVLMLPSILEYRRNLIEIISRGRRLGSQMLFMTQPMLYDSTEKWQRVKGGVFFIKSGELVISCATYWRMMDIFNKELIGVCREHEVPCLDLASMVPHDENYFYDMVHFTEAGAALVAELASKAIAE